MLVKLNCNCTVSLCVSGIKVKRGFRKEICANTGRSRLNLSGAIDLISKKLHIQGDVTLNAESTISFLKKIEAAYPNKNKIHLAHLFPIFESLEYKRLPTSIEKK